MDDGIAVNSTFMASVLDSPSPNRLNVRRNAGDTFGNGLAISLVDVTTGAEVAGGAIVSQTPAFTAPVVSGGTVALEFDRALTAVPRNSGLVLSGATARGAGTLVENNVVEDVQFARGIYIAGAAGITVRNNVVRRTTSAGSFAPCRSRAASMARRRRRMLNTFFVSRP